MADAFRFPNPAKNSGLGSSAGILGVDCRHSTTQLGGESRRLFQDSACLLDGSPLFVEICREDRLCDLHNVTSTHGGFMLGEHGNLLGHELSLSLDTCK